MKNIPPLSKTHKANLRLLCKVLLNCDQNV